MFLSPLKYLIAPLNLSFSISFESVIFKIRTFCFCSPKSFISFAIIVVVSSSLILNLPSTITMFSSTKLFPDFKYAFSKQIISAVPYKSSIVTNAIILLFFVYFFFIEVIIPAYFTFCPSWYFGLTFSLCFNNSISGWFKLLDICSSRFLNSIVLILVCLSISFLNFSNGWPEIYIPSISFSSDNKSFLGNSSCSSNLYFISFISSFSSSEPKSNIETWPDIPFFFPLWIVSIIPSNDASNVLLVCSNSSKAPAFIKLSMHFLFTASSAILSQKSTKFLYSPCSSLSFTMLLTGTVPTFLMLPKPKRIAKFELWPVPFSSFGIFGAVPKSSTVNFVLLLFISGFSICIPSDLHSSIYCGILSRFPKKLFNVAAINSAG